MYAFNKQLTRSWKIGQFNLVSQCGLASEYGPELLFHLESGDKFIGVRTAPIKSHGHTTKGGLEWAPFP